MGSRVITGVIKKWGVVGACWWAVHMGAWGAAAGAAQRGGGPMPKDGYGSFGPIRTSLPQVEGAGFIMWGGSGSWAETCQTRCMGGMKPCCRLSSPASPSPLRLCRWGTWLCSPPPRPRHGPGMGFPCTPSSTLKHPCCTWERCTDLPVGDMQPPASPVPACPGLGAHKGRLGPGLGQGSGVYLFFFYY